MHRDRSVGFFGAVLAGVVTHAGIAGLEALIPGIGEQRLDPFLRLVPAVLAGFLATGGPGRSLRGYLTRGALAGGLANLVGIAVSLLLGQPGTQILPPLVSVAGAGVMVGLMVGGLRRAQSPRRHEEGWQESVKGR